MGLFDWFKINNGIKLSNSNFPEGLKWIYFSFVVYFNGLSKKDIIKIAEDITNIVNNVHNINGKGLIIQIPNTRNSLSRGFYPIIEKKGIDGN